MASKKKSKRPSARPRATTAIVPRVVFQTMVAVAVVPAMAALPGCGTSTTPQDSGFFGVALPNDAGRDAGVFAVAVPIDAGHDAGMFGVADVGPPNDVGTFSVAAPLDAAFSVIVAPGDAATS